MNRNYFKQTVTNRMMPIGFEKEVRPACPNVQRNLNVITVAGYIILQNY